MGLRIHHYNRIDRYQTLVIRDLSIDFYDIDYNNFLIQSWFDNTKLRKEATFEMDGVYFDSVAFAAIVLAINVNDSGFYDNTRHYYTLFGYKYFVNKKTT